MHVALTFERAGDRRAGVTLARKVADWVRHSGRRVRDRHGRRRHTGAAGAIAIDEEVAGCSA